MNIQIVKIEKPNADTNMILGQSHFIKTVEDIHETLVTTAPALKWGLAFNESSGPCLVRYTGNEERLVELAKENALRLSTGHTFIIFLENGFPINVLNALKQVPEVCGIYCATANPVEVIVVETEQGRGILGVVDGFKAKGVESESDIEYRKAFLRKIGYKM
jgi:adenosine/AMP kinase